MDKWIIIHPAHLLSNPFITQPAHLPPLHTISTVQLYMHYRHFLTKTHLTDNPKWYSPGKGVLFSSFPTHFLSFTNSYSNFIFSPTNYFLSYVLRNFIESSMFFHFLFAEGTVPLWIQRCRDEPRFEPRRPKLKTILFFFLMKMKTNTYFIFNKISHIS